MTLFDAKTDDDLFQGADLLAAALHPTQAARAEAVRRGRERLARAASVAEALAAPAGTGDTGSTASPAA